MTLHNVIRCLFETRMTLWGHCVTSWDVLLTSKDICTYISLESCDQMMFIQIHDIMASIVISFERWLNADIMLCRYLNPDALHNSLSYINNYHFLYQIPSNNLHKRWPNNENSGCQAADFSHTSVGSDIKGVIDLTDEAAFFELLNFKLTP